MLKLGDRTLVNRVYQLTRTLLLRARAETVERRSRTVEDGGRERLWSDVNQSLIQPTKYIPIVWGLQWVATGGDTVFEVRVLPS